MQEAHNLPRPRSMHHATCEDQEAHNLPRPRSTQLAKTMQHTACQNHARSTQLAKTKKHTTCKDKKPTCAIYLWYNIIQLLVTTLQTCLGVMYVGQVSVATREYTCWFCFTILNTVITWCDPSSKPLRRFMHGVSGLLNRLLSVIIGVLFDLTQTIEFGFTSHTLFFYYTLTLLRSHWHGELWHGQLTNDMHEYWHGLIVIWKQLHAFNTIFHHFSCTIGLVISVAQ